MENLVKVIPKVRQWPTTEYLQQSSRLKDIQQQLHFIIKSNVGVLRRKMPDCFDGEQQPPENKNCNKYN